MNPARVLATAGVALACLAASPGAPPTTAGGLNGDQVLARAKAVFRAYPRPPYVAYTLVRRDRHNGAPDFSNSYTLKIWCRTADRSALARKAWNGKAYGDLQNITVMFDKAVDPGPPTADMFEKRLFGEVSARRDDGRRVIVPRGVPVATAAPDPGASAAPADAGIAEIGRVAARDGDYSALRMAVEGGLIHLWLTPKSDLERNRLDEMWVDAHTFDLRRARIRDHLYLGMGGQSLEDEFDATFAPGPGGLPLLASIHGETRYGEFETDYTFAGVTFPDALPDWYFAPQQYGLHRSDAPG